MIDDPHPTFCSQPDVASKYKSTLSMTIWCPSMYLFKMSFERFDPPPAIFIKIHVSFLVRGSSPKPDPEKYSHMKIYMHLTK